MATKTLSTRIVMRNDTAENWTTKNPVLLKGEFGVERIRTNLKFAIALVNQPHIISSRSSSGRSGRS